MHGVWRTHFQENWTGKMMERKGKKESSVILGKGQGFLYFIWLIVLRRFLIRSVSLRLECIQYGCTIFGALIFHCVFVVFVILWDIFKILCLLSYKWWSIRLQMSNGYFNPRVAHGHPVIIEWSYAAFEMTRPTVCRLITLISLVRFDSVDFLCRFAI